MNGLQSLAALPSKHTICKVRKVKWSRYTPWWRLGGRGADVHLLLFLNPTLEGGEWSASRPGRALPPGKEPPVPEEGTAEEKKDDGKVRHKVRRKKERMREGI
jgi:hypothetical protein